MGKVYFPITPYFKLLNNKLLIICKKGKSKVVDIGKTGTGK